MHVQAIVNELLNRGLVKRGELRGCSNRETGKLEAEFGFRLPSEYVHFLKLIGKGAGSFLLGTSIFYRDLPSLRESAEELLVESGSTFVLPKSAFVFCSHQGYQFMYFDALPYSEDPPVFYYLENDLKPNVRWPSFTAFLMGYL